MAAKLVLLTTTIMIGRLLTLATPKARVMGLSVACLSGFSEDNPLRGRGDVDLWVDSHSYNVVEMTHHIWLLSVVDHLIETAD